MAKVHTYATYNADFNAFLKNLRFSWFSLGQNFLTFYEPQSTEPLLTSLYDGWALKTVTEGEGQVGK